MKCKHCGQVVTLSSLYCWNYSWPIKWIRRLPAKRVRG